jgi:orotidine-5'-phosphate decarboxylase
MSDSRIIVALDVATPKEAFALVDQLGETISFYKVGMELYAAAGMSLIKDLLSAKKQVFLDLKFYDIGETVKRAVAVVAATGVHLLTVHAHSSIVKAAVEGRAGSPLKLLGVTVLTSFNEDDLHGEGYVGTLQDLVDARACMALDAGVDGLVCSALEVGRLRQIAGSKPLLVTPGVRSAGADAGDQKRVATPAEAIRSGASHLVVGRQITRAADPRAAALAIAKEITV